MFEHLDDPAPPEATARTLGAVLARAARLRRRRATSALGGVVVGALAVGVVIGVAVSGPTPSQTFAAFESQAGLLATGTPVPSSDLASVVFVGDVHGFALVVHGTQTLLAVSADGGDTWTVADPSLPVSFPAQFEFSDTAHGYLWGGPPSATGHRRAVGDIGRGAKLGADGARSGRVRRQCHRARRVGRGRDVSHPSLGGPVVPRGPRGVHRQRADLDARRCGPAVVGERRGDRQ